MKLKLNPDGFAIVKDGKPVYEGDDGKEIAFDAPGTVATIARLNGEAKGHREAKEALEVRLKSFDGIEDPAKARQAMEIAANLDSKKLIDAGEKDKAIAAAIAATEAKYKPTLDENSKLKKDLYGEKIGGAFARSKFLADKAAIPADMVQARFGSHFKIEDGKVVAYADGNKLFSRSRPGEVADFEEALEIVIDRYPHKDQILKGSGASGSGAGASNQSGSGGKKQMSREQFNKLDPLAQRSTALEAAAGKTEIVD